MLLMSPFIAAAFAAICFFPAAIAEQPLAAQTTFIPIEQCPQVGKCCEEDCCGQGTSWDSTLGYCVYSLDSDGFSGTYSSEYQAGCVSRLCCGAGCCSPGLQYDESEAFCIPPRPVCTAPYYVQVGKDIDGEAGGDSSGTAVSLSEDGTIVAVGAYVNGDFAGHVRVFHWNTHTWVQLGADIDGENAVDSSNPGDSSGWSVSLSSDGSILAIGAPFNNDNGFNSGNVRVFKWDGTDWNQMGTDIDGKERDMSGYSVSLSSDGSIVAIGAREGLRERGRVRVFQWNGTEWSQLGKAIDGEAKYDGFGHRVSLSSDGTIVAVRARPYRHVDGSTTGNTRVFQWRGTIWAQLGEAIIDGGEFTHYDPESDGFSVSLSEDGSVLAIGAANYGHTRVFQWNGATWDQMGNDINGGRNSGYDVSLSSDGRILAIGTPYDDDANDSLFSGKVRVYQWIADAWVQVAVDIVGEAPDDGFGWSVSLSGDGGTIAIGAPANDAIGYNSGHVRVYDCNLPGPYPTPSPTARPTPRPTPQPSIPSIPRCSTFYVQVGQDIDGEAGGDFFGGAVSLSKDGSVVAVGAYQNDGNGEDSGHVRVFHWNNNTWDQLGADIDGEKAGDLSGLSVSLSSDGSILAIGAPRNRSSNNYGHVRVFKWDGTDWNQLGNDIDEDRSADEWWYGYSVSLSSDGTIVAIGAPGGGDDTGFVQVFQWNRTDWIQLGFILGEAEDDYTGDSVSLSGDGTIVAIGAPYNDPINNGVRLINAGHVRVHQWNGTMWMQLGDDIDGEARDDHSGASVSLSADGFVLAVGASSARVRVFIWDGGSWNQRGNDIDDEASAYSSSSVSLSSDGDILAIGGPSSDGVTGTSSGHFRLYQWATGAWVQIDVDNGGEANGDLSGRSVSVSGDGSIIAIGAPHHDGVNGSDSGHVRVISCN